MTPGSGSGTGTPVVPAVPPVPGTAIYNSEHGNFPLLPLDTFRKEMSMHPWHFWGMANTSLVRVNSACDTLVAEYAWQASDAAGRHDIREAILAAEEKMRTFLRFSPAPRFTEETVPVMRHYDKNMWRLGSTDSDGRWISVQLHEGEVQSLGIEKLVLLDTPVITYSDEDGDGLEDSWTVTVTTTETDINRIAVYFRSTDRYADEPVGDRWRIQPVRISISGGVATIRGPKWIMVRPVLYQGYNYSGSGLDPDTDANFVTNVEVYQRMTYGDGTTEETSQGVLTWESKPWPSWAAVCCASGTDSSSDPAAIASAVARVGIRDAANGLVIPSEATYDATAGTWAAYSTLCRPPDRVTVRYYAGMELGGDGQMNRRLSQAVARLAAAELSRPICACGVANRELYRWQFDVSQTTGAAQEEYTVSPDDLNNPFGTRRGQIEAWKMVRSLAMKRGLAF